MKKGVTIIFFVIIFLSMIIGLSAQENPEVCFSDGTSRECLKEQNILKLFDNEEDFAKLTPKIREGILEKYYDKFIAKFKQKNPTEQARFMMTKDSNGRFLMSDVLITKTFHSLEQTQKQNFAKALGEHSYKTIQNDKYFRETYGQEAGEFNGLQEVVLNDPNNKLQWKTDEKGALKLVGEKGGYINFGEGPDSLSKFITKIKYDDGKFTVTMGKDIEVEFEQGTLAPNGGFFSPDGKLVSGDKMMSFLFENKKDQHQKKFSVSFIEENGRKYTEIRISAVNNDYKATGLKFVDINGDNYYIGLNPDNFDDPGDRGSDAIVRIDAQGIVEVKGGFVETSSYGTYKLSNNHFTALIGNVFNEPGQGVQNLEQRIKSVVGDKLSENIIAEAKKIFGDEITEGKISNPEIQDGKDVAKAREEFIKLSTTIIEEDSGVDKTTAETIVNSLFKVGQSVGYISQGLGYLTSTSSMVEDMLISLGISSYSIGSETLQDSIQQFVHPSYEQFQKEGRSFLYVNDVYSDLKREHIVDFFASGGYMGIDITKVKGTIDSISANNFLHKVTNEQSNGEIIYFNNGGFLLGFRGAETVDRTGTVVDSVRNPYYYNLAQKEIGAIKNWMDNDNHYYVLTKDSNGVDFFRNDERVRLSSAGSKYLIGDRFGVRGTRFYAGGAQLSEIPKDPKAYPLPDDSKMEFIVDPQVVSYRGGIGWRIRKYAAYNIALPQIQSQASQSTVAIANQIDSSVNERLSSIVRESYGGNIDNFFGDVGRARWIISTSDYFGGAEADTLLESFFPGQNAQETRDMVYLIDNPDKYTQTLKAFASTGTITSGTSAGLSNKGFYYNKQYVANQDSRITSYLLKQAAQNPPPSTSITLSEAQAETGRVPAAQSYDIVKTLTSQFGIAVTQSQTSQASSSVSSSTSSSQVSTVKTPRKVCVRKGLLGRRSYCYYVYD